MDTKRECLVLFSFSFPYIFFASFWMDVGSTRGEIGMDGSKQGLLKFFVNVSTFSLVTPSFNIDILSSSYYIFLCTNIRHGK